MNELFAGFDWDQGNRDKCRKHGVSVAEIEGLFSREPAIRPDLHHSQAEQRLLAVGEGRQGRTVFLVFTIRERDGRPTHPAHQRPLHACEGD